MLFNVDCSSAGYPKSSIPKAGSASSAPQNATITLYSLGDTDFYQYDLTNSLSNTSTIGQWNN